MRNVLWIDEQPWTWAEFAWELLKEDTQCLAVWLTMPEDPDAPDAEIVLDFLDAIVDHTDIAEREVGVIYSPDFEELHYMVCIQVAELDYGDDDDMYHAIVDCVREMMREARQSKPGWH